MGKFLSNTAQSKMKSVQECYTILSSETSSCFERYNCLGLLRTHGNDEAAQALADAYPHLGTSELCRHDVMYCIGQMRRENSLDFLMKHLRDTSEYGIVRHEAAEAMSNFFDLKDSIVKVYDELLATEPEMPEILKSTLVVAREKMLTYSESTRFGKKFLGTIEPAEPMDRLEICEMMLKHFGNTQDSEFLVTETEFWGLVRKLALLDISTLGEYNKHRVAYFLRDTASDPKNPGCAEAVKLLEDLMRRENWAVTTALLRHEVAFIFGQVYDNAQSSGEMLEAVCDDDDESPIVRHEVIMALEDITKSKKCLEKYLKHENQVIRESAEVALHN